MRKYVFENGRTNLYGVLSLESDGKIKGYENSNEVFWKEEGEDLIFFNSKKETTTIFKKIGDEYVDGKKWHYLKPYSSLFPFTENIEKYKTDKFYHNLLPFYENKFKYIKNENIKIIEVGCLGYASIKYWLDYFPNAKVYGLDVNLGNFNHERFEFFQVNQRDKNKLNEVASKIGEIDIVIDDGAHTYDETKNVFDVFWPRVKTNGYYVIEDWDWMSDLITEIIQSRGELGGGIKGTRGLKPIDLRIKHLEVSTNDNRAYALFQKR